MNHESPDKENSQGHGEPSKLKWWKVPLFVVLYISYIVIGVYAMNYVASVSSPVGLGQRGNPGTIVVGVIVIIIAVTAQLLLNPNKKQTEKRKGKNAHRNT